jgi:hypothetical protein
MPQRDIRVAHPLLVAEASRQNNLFEVAESLFEFLP